jgi:hypothetical protein
MNKYNTTIAVAISLVIATTLTHAQTTAGNKPSDDGYSTDIVQVAFTGIGVGASSENNNGVNVELTNIFAYNVIPQFSMGVGIGYESVPDENSSSYLPLSADFRWYFIQSKVTPFVNLNGGYSFNLTEGGRGGDDIFTGLNLGVRIITRSNIGILFAAGLKYEDVIYHYNFYYYPASMETVTKNYFYVPITFGLEF